MAAILLLSTLLSLSTIILSLSENINIDCGASESYEDSNNVTWVGDKDFVSTGKSYEFPVNGVNTTLRYFPPASGELNCYKNIPATRGRKTLVRTFFSYANYDNKSSPPSFIVAYDVKHYEGVVLPPLNDEDQSVFISEVIFSPASKKISVCLLGKPLSLGVPFISSIEVYGMDEGMYNDLGPGEGLIGRQRLAYGAKKIIRYPSDPYGRLWFPSESDNPTISELTTSASSIDMTDASNKPPKIVMSKAWLADDSRLLENILPSVGIPVYLALYFSEPQSLGRTQKRSFSVFLNKTQLGSGPIEPIFGKATQVVVRDILSNSSQLIFQSAKDSDLPQIINALELYSVSNGMAGGESDWKHIHEQIVKKHIDSNSKDESDWKHIHEQIVKKHIDSNSKEEKEKAALQAAEYASEVAKETKKLVKAVGAVTAARNTTPQNIRIVVGVMVPAAFVAILSAIAAFIKRHKTANPQSNTAPAAIPEGSGAETGESPLVGKQLASDASQPA